MTIHQRRNGRPVRVEGHPYRDPDQMLFRFTVRCDRDQNRKIERLAKAAGVTPTTFVQQHFETIFTAPPVVVEKQPEPEPAPEPVPDEVVPRKSTRQYRDDDGLTPSQRQKMPVVLEVMRELADLNGRVKASHTQVARRAGISHETFRNLLPHLKRLGKVAVVHPGGKSKRAVYVLTNYQPPEDLAQ